jgi:acyl CoA:acetate/3-ketoacid CoA transferase alpha subunit/acyl CoA:acetate/3-ketoacid CoA transferase beta subunit
MTPILPSFELAADYGTTKVVALADAIRRHVVAGMALHVCWSDARPNGALMEIVRQFRGRAPGFVLSGVGFANHQVALVEAGLVKRLVTAYAGESYPAGAVNPLFKRAIDAGDVEIEHWSQWTLVARLMAGALGLPFFPTRSLAGSGLAQDHLGHQFEFVDDPFGGGRAGVVAPLVPDLAIVQGVAADANGNVVMASPYGEGAWGALAARRGVIACVEKIVSTDEIRRYNADVRIPGHVVVAVCEVPYGSHPYGSFSGAFDSVPGYVEDAAFIAGVAAACADRERFAAWLDEWVIGVGDHAGYLARLGGERLARLRASAAAGHWRNELPAIARAADASAPTAEETMIVASARRIAAAVRRAGHQTVLAGIGASNLAAWLAERELTASGIDVALLSEIGIYGTSPRPGEPFVFSNRNLATARCLTDVSTTLGTLVAGRHNRCLGALGAAMIDQAGNIASTYDNTGGFIVGSGGANDIASAAAEVLVTVRHGASRLVPRVEYVTSPGHAVRTIVTTKAVLERADGAQPFRIVALLGAPSTSIADAIADVQAGCGWPLAVADGIAFEAPPTSDELAALRMFDPARTFLGRRAGAAAATQ